MSQISTQSVSARKLPALGAPRAIAPGRVPAHLAMVLDASFAKRSEKQLEELIQGCLENGVAWLSLCPSGNREQRADALGALKSFAEENCKSLHDYGVGFGGQNSSLNIHFIDQTGREELVCAVQKLAAKGIVPAALTEQMLLEHLPSAHLPPVDLLIHFSGTRSLSDFLTWQCAYAELLFLDAVWTKFSVAHLDYAFKDYAQRKRTYGGLK